MDTNGHILMVADEYSPTVIMIKNLFDKMTADYPHFSCSLKLEAHISAEDINKADTLYFVRSRSVYAYELAKECRRLNKRIVYFIDDDFLSLGDDYGLNKAGVWKVRKQSLEKMLVYGDAVSSANKLLAEKYAKIGNIKQISCCDTVVTKEELTPHPEKSEKCRIFLYINDGSTDMFNKYVLPAMKVLGERLPGKIELDLLSLHPDCSEISDKIKVSFIPHMNYESFLKFVSEKPYDIGLAPLDDDGFNRYKYYNKYVEYTKAGAFGVYSDCPLYQSIVVDGYNGALVENTPASWADAIEKYFNDYQLRYECVDNAQKVIIERFTYEAITKKRLNDIPELLATKPDAKKISGVTVLKLNTVHVFARLRERIYLTVRYYQTGGFKGVVGAIKRRISANIRDRKRI